MNVKEIGNAIADVVDQYGFSIDKNYCGHGIGKLFHTNPTVPHYRSKLIFKNSRIMCR